MMQANKNPRKFISRYVISKFKNSTPIGIRGPQRPGGRFSCDYARSDQDIDAP